MSRWLRGRECVVLLGQDIQQMIHQLTIMAETAKGTLKEGEERYKAGMIPYRTHLTSFPVVFGFEGSRHPLGLWQSLFNRVILY